MSTENKELVVHFYNELFGHGNLDVIDKYIGDEYIQHNPYAPNGTEALRGFVTGFKARYPDLRHDVVRVIAEDDLVLLQTGGQRDLERNPALAGFSLVSEPSVSSPPNGARAGFRSVSQARY